MSNSLITEVFPTAEIIEFGKIQQGDRIAYQRGQGALAVFVAEHRGDGYWSDEEHECEFTGGTAYRIA